MKFRVTTPGVDGCVLIYAETPSDGVFLAQLAEAMREKGYNAIAPKPSSEKPYLKIWPTQTGKRGEDK